MLKNLALPSSSFSSCSSSTLPPLLLLISSSLSKPTPNLSKPFFSHSNFTIKPVSPFPSTFTPISSKAPSMSIWNKLGFGSKTSEASAELSAIAQGPDDDIPAPGQQFAQFGAGCFWGVELVFQRVPGVTKTEVGYTQGHIHNPTYKDVCSGQSYHSEVVRVQYDPKECSYESLLDAFWARHDPTAVNRQGEDAGTQYRSGIYFYTPEQEKAAQESMERHQKSLNRKIVTEILPAKKFYRAEEYHQQYLEKGSQSAAKGCNDPIQCYGFGR